MRVDVRNEVAQGQGRECGLDPEVVVDQERNPKRQNSVLFMYWHFIH